MKFSDELINWYNFNKRDLPWRNTTDAYIIWLSEIILQQTRVDQGMPYFYRFVEKYPDVERFAAADEGAILKLWQGLGYYSRGRNMLKTARLVQQQYHGRFPDKYEDLVKLTGIGDYTAAAIASFSAGEPRAVVDGNVYRVLARYFGINTPVNSPKGKKEFQQLANELLNQQQPGLHNQAVMEFGALLCKPKNPACGICPLRMACFAFNNNAVGALPVKLKKLKIKERFFNYFLYTDGVHILLNKRAENDIWANMYDLPLIETKSLLSIEEVFYEPETMEFFGGSIRLKKTFPIHKQLLTHQRLFVRFIEVNDKPIKMKDGWIFTELINLKSLPLPKVIFIFLDKFLN